MTTWNNETNNERNALVFEGRNRAYGAYELRSNYNRNLTYIMGGMVGFVFLVWSAKAAFGKVPDAALPKDDLVVIYTLEPPKPLEEPIELKVETAEMPEQRLVETLRFTPPVIKDNVEELAQNTQDDVKDTQVGNSDVKGTDDEVLPPADGKPGGDGVTEIKGPDVFTVVEEMPEFPGGTTEMIKYIQKNLQYPAVARDLGLGGKCFLKFVVSETGAITKIELLKGVLGCRECDEEAKRVIQNMPNWKPGKQNGRAVSVYFNLPINFQVK